jgi:selenocysteine-specific elongation factor
MTRSTVPRSAIIGTAGHIDHGKTALIARLTGIETDRLPEEKKRGISIELGFAHLDLSDGERAGIIDVPGHEKFVRQMLAGAGGMDLVMLVIAADEGVMPQTREHLEIVSLLQIPAGFVVLTKVDMVDDPEWLDVVEADVRDATRGTLFDGQAVIRTSAKTGEGIDEVRSEIERRLASGEFVSRGREARLPVDRVFTMQGFGTVITGTIWAGAFRVGDPVTLLPSGIASRVKAVQVHDTEVEEAVAGQRTAISLHRVEKEKVHRGEWLVKTDALKPSHMMDAWFEALSAMPRGIKNRSRVRVHLGASELLARLVLLDRDEVKPGERAPVQLRLETPGVAERADRYVIRQYSPMRTIGGGTIIDPNARKRRRFEGDPAAEFRRMEEGSPVDRLGDLLSTKGLHGENTKRLREDLGLAAPDFAALARDAREAGVVVGESRLFAAAMLGEATGRVERTIRDHHERHPVLWGIPVGELKAGFSQDMNPALFDLARERLLADGTVVERDEYIAIAARPGELADDALADAERVLALFADGQFAPRELDRVVRDSELPNTRDLIGRLLFERRLVAISKEFVYPAETLEELKRRLRSYFAEHERLGVGEAKAIFGEVSRKHVVPLLEYSDRQGFTRRDGDARVAGGGLS